MKKSSLIVITLICILAFQSCAFHREFPFICYAKACVKEQWQFKGIKNAFRKGKRKLGLGKKKPYVENDRKKGKKGSSDNSEANRREAVKDSINNAAKDSISNLKFGKSAIDTVIVIYFKNESDSLSEADQLFLKNFFIHHKKKITEIDIVEFYDPSVHTAKLFRRKNVKKYLLNIPISKQLIVLRRYKKKGVTLTQTMYERVEIRIR